MLRAATAPPPELHSALASLQARIIPLTSWCWSRTSSGGLQGAGRGWAGCCRCPGHPLSPPQLGCPCASPHPAAMATSIPGPALPWGRSSRCLRVPAGKISPDCGSWAHPHTKIPPGSPSPRPCHVTRCPHPSLRGGDSPGSGCTPSWVARAGQGCGLAASLRALPGPPGPAELLRDSPGRPGAPRAASTLLRAREDFGANYRML